MGRDRGNIQKLKHLAVERGVRFDEEEIGNLIKMIEEIPDVRMDKVNKVKDQIMSGSYNPPIKNIVTASSSVMNF